MEQRKNSTEITGVEKAVRDVMEATGEIRNRRSRYQAALRDTMIQPILWSLGWCTWLPRECGPDFSLGRRGRVDYALLDTQGEIAVYICAQPSDTRRRYGRIRLRDCVRGANQGVGVLIYGSSWEIYDLSRRSRLFDDKRVGTLVIDLDLGDRAEHAAEVLSRWLHKNRWWHEPDESSPDH